MKVSTSAASQVTKTVSGTVKDVHPGDTVVVRGTTQKNGTVAPSSISVGGAGAAFGAAARRDSVTANGGATGFGGSTTKGGG